MAIEPFEDIHRLPKRLRICASFRVPTYDRNTMRAELDSHADTTALGPGCLILHDTGNKVTVEPFAATLGSALNIPIVKAAIAYDNPTDFHTYILIFHEVLYVEALASHLLCPFQMRDSGVEVADIPLQHLNEEF